MLDFDLDTLIRGLQAYAWPFLRVTGLLLVAPVLGANLVPNRVKLLLAVGLTIVIAPLVPPPPAMDPFGADALLTALQQLLIGVAIGFAVQVAFDALVMAGQVISMTMGLGFATMVDPSRGSATPVVSQFFLILGLLTFLAVDAHLLLIGVLADSFRTMPPGPQGFGPDHLVTLAAWGGRIFEAGLVLALPAVVGLLVVNLALGVISRAAPQLNLFAVGFPLSTMLGFVLILLSLPALATGFQGLLAEALAFAGTLVGTP